MAVLHEHDRLRFLAADPPRLACLDQAKKLAPRKDDPQACLRRLAVPRERKRPQTGLQGIRTLHLHRAQQVDALGLLRLERLPDEAVHGAAVGVAKLVPPQPGRSSRPAAPPGTPGRSQRAAEPAHAAKDVLHRRADQRRPAAGQQYAMRHADSHSTLRYDMARENLDRHAARAVAAYLAGMSAD